MLRVISTLICFLGCSQVGLGQKHVEQGYSSVNPEFQRGPDHMALAKWSGWYDGIMRPKGHDGMTWKERE